jgi:hypothetical protein
MTTQPLREVIESRLNLRWTDWAARHPHLAAAIDREHLIDRTAASIRADPRFAAALAAAEVDEATLACAAKLLDVLETVLDGVLPG